jgi:allophanate hydrolase subunit 2
MVAPAEGGELVSEGMPPGAVQVAGGGGPIVLGVDGPTTGGYPVIACVATADMPELGRARPGDTLRFRRVTVDEARALLHERERVFDESFDADRGEARHGPAVDRPQL